MHTHNVGALRGQVSNKDGEELLVRACDTDEGIDGTKGGGFAIEPGSRPKAFMLWFGEGESVGVGDLGRSLDNAFDILRTPRIHGLHIASSVFLGR